MKQRSGVLVARQPGQQVHHAGEHREPLTPAFRQVAHAEIQPDSERLARVRAGFQQANHRLGDDEGQVPLQAVAQTATVMRQLVAIDPQVDPDFAVDNLGRECRRIVGPKIERAAGGHVEARVVPVAGQDSVVHAAAVERKSHVGAAIVERVHGVAVADQHQRAPVDAQAVAAAGREVAQLPGIDLAVTRHGSDLHPPVPQCSHRWARQPSLGARM